MKGNSLFNEPFGRQKKSPRREGNHGERGVKMGGKQGKTERLRKSVEEGSQKESIQMNKIGGVKG